MLPRLTCALAVAALLATSAAAQVVRFETTVGSFDMVLNPTNDPVLQDYANNMIQYVEDNRYLGSWINRAVDDFVLQMGGFFSHTKRPPLTINSVRSVYTYAPVAGEPAAETGLSNTVGTVSLALPGSSAGTDQDGGTSSFFINLGNNDFLDADFTVFAAISDMTVVNQIMALTKIDRTTDELFGAGSGNLAFSDVPVQDNGFQVFIKRAFVITDTLAVAKARAGVNSVLAASAASYGDGAGGSGALSATVVPEPASGILFIIGMIALSLWERVGWSCLGNSRVTDCRECLAAASPRYQ
jgi:cyclophilin family peptidyl-prolyl cis-trans isomerase